MFLRAVYLFHHSNCSNLSLEVMYLFLSQKEWESSIIWKVLYLFWQENLQSSIVLVILSAVVFLLPKKVGSSYSIFQRYYNYFYRILAAIHCFNGTVHFFGAKICSCPILSTHFLSAYFRTPFTEKQISYQSNYIFRAASITLNERSHLKQCFYTERFFFTIPSCLE